MAKTALRAGEVPEGAQVWVTHFFSHPGSSLLDRRGFHDALRAAGFGTPGAHTEIDADEEVAGDGFWHHWAFTVIPASEASLAAADHRARDIADGHGVQYDGWSVQRDPITGKPRVA
jgi:hypothetical protein